MDKHTIINLKNQGYSNRALAKMLCINRKTIAKYWNKHIQQVNSLNNPNVEILEIQEQIAAAPSYDTSKRTFRKYNSEIDSRLDEILKEEIEKNNILGPHKQKLTKVQIHQILVNDGFDIGYTTISKIINLKVPKLKECFIKQSYEYGDRLEYDFGEVKLVVNEELKTYYIAVMSSPASNFRWAYIYENQKKSVFLDSHVRFFEMIGGVYREVVYDNMRNVVKKFIGKNEKELNEDLIKMSLYYGYNINVTNCFKGNEKGHVEGSVKKIRNNLFALKYRFESFEEVTEYLDERLTKLNEKVDIDSEKMCLLDYKPKLELAEILSNTVNKYSFIQVDNNFYSVPDYLVGKEVTTKLYYNKVLVYGNNNFVCEHKRIDGQKQICIEINHYLKSLQKKPGAIKNSLALKSNPKLKSIYDKYFSTNQKKFIEILMDNKEKNQEEVIDILNKYTSISLNVVPLDYIYENSSIYENTKNQIFKYSNLCIKNIEGADYEN
jgi:transposase